MPTFTLKALKAGVKKVELYYNNKSLCAQIGGEVVRVKNEGDIDRIKKEKRNDHQIRKVAVHETGHAVAYACLFGYVPTQVAVLVASDDRNGFVGLHGIDTTRNHLLWQIRVLLSGRIAEEIVFGKDNVNGGAVGDIDRATTLAANLVRLYGMGDKMSRLDTMASHQALAHNLDLKGSNEEIETILRAEKMEAENLLRKHIGLLRDMTNHLIKYEKISDNKFISLCREHGVVCSALDAKETVFPKYREMYNSYWENAERELK